MKLSRREKRLGAGESISQTPQATSPFEASKKKGYKKYILLSGVGLIILLIIYGVYSMSGPGQYDDFAKCLNEKGVIMYGALNWCKYTQAQKAMFGNSFKYLNYKEHTELPGIKKTPTWVIDGKWYENTQSFDKLSQITSCAIK